MIRRDGQERYGQLISFLRDKVEDKEEDSEVARSIIGN